MSAPLHLYLHVPFCVRRCTFCNQKIYPATPETCKAYANALLAELEATAPDFSGDPVQTVYWGGGSPTALSQDDFARIMRRIRTLFSLSADTEVTVEALPNRVDARGWSPSRTRGQPAGAGAGYCPHPGAGTHWQRKQYAQL